jgi:polar amino acid transport system substrate-binding protein
MMNKESGMMKRFIKAVSILFVVSMLLVACSQSSTNTSSSGGSNSKDKEENNSKEEQSMLQEEGIFHFVASGEYQPFSYFKDGVLTGFDIEIGNEIAKRLDLKPKASTTPFSGIISGIQTGRYDAAIASHVITEERAQAVDFADPYYISGGQLFVQPDENGINTLDDLKGKDVAVALGTTHEKMAREYTDSISTYDSDITALRALEQGKHDVTITDITVGEIAIQTGMKIKIAGPMLSEVQHGIAVRKGNAELLDKINKALADIHADGTYLKLSEKYFGRDISKKQ